MSSSSPSVAKAGGRVFITGGASGLGRALALRYARQGFRVCISDIDDVGGLRTLSTLTQDGGPGHYLHCDVRLDDDLQGAADWLEQTWGGVDVVINNAGVAVGGGIAEVPLVDWQWIVDINLLGVVRGCRTFTPLLRRQGRGHLVNVASMAGLVHPPMMAAYSATKSAVVALSETLRAELASDGILVSVACPSFFRTALAEASRSSNPDAARLGRKLVDSARYTADEIAERIQRGVARGEFHIMTHPEGHLMWMAKRYAPSWLYIAAMRAITRLVQSRH